MKKVDVDQVAVRENGAKCWSGYALATRFPIIFAVIVFLKPGPGQS